MPEPPLVEGQGTFLESDDVFLMGRDILVGRSGNGSNEKGAKWLQRYLGDEYRVHEVPLSPNFLHLDCVMCAPRPGLAMVCREAFVNGLPDIIKDWDIIDVSPEDAEKHQGTAQARTGSD
ncbi:amidinotransferase [Seminavis robusta]|uniref:Glycine amidinotransferase, mitochondrial n=1 Tax=Seminavis robusta TaxID=568900 RepID=A0A9N8E013_9STRA|nr:amidinotransferase [Seminavis robusta]|eukprot:Sro428_g140960.1 amidinotransferase (120) ;mRNA; f:65557-65916